MTLTEFFELPEVANFLKVKRGFEKASDFHEAITRIRSYLIKVDPHILRDIDRQFDIANPPDLSPEGALRGWVEEQCSFHG